MSETATPQDSRQTPRKGYSGWRSRTTAYVPRDQRTREARLLRQNHAELVAYLGGKASPTQAALIEQIGQLKLRIGQMDRQFALAGAMSEHDSRTYLAWSNTLTRTLAALGLKTPKQRPQTLHELLDEPAAATPPSEP